MLKKFDDGDFKLPILLGIIIGVFFGILLGIFSAFEMDGDKLSILGSLLILLIPAFILSLFVFEDNIDLEKEHYWLMVFIIMATGMLIITLFNFSTIYPLLDNLNSILIFVLMIIALVELFFLLDEEKPGKKESHFWFACKRKGEALLEVILGISLITYVAVLIREIDLSTWWPTILKWMGYLGVGLCSIAIVVGIFYLWIKLNSLKYRK